MTILSATVEVPLCQRCADKCAHANPKAVMIGGAIGAALSGLGAAGDGAGLGSAVGAATLFGVIGAGIGWALSNQAREPAELIGAHRYAASGRDSGWYLLFKNPAYQRDFDELNGVTRRPT